MLGKTLDITLVCYVLTYRILHVQPFLPCMPSNVSDPHSIRSMDPYPDPDSESGSGSRWAKMTHNSSKKLRNCIFWSAGCSRLRAEGFFFSLDVIITLDPDWIRIRIGIQPKMLDPDPYKWIQIRNTDAYWPQMDFRFIPDDKRKPSTVTL